MAPPNFRLAYFAMTTICGLGIFQRFSSEVARVKDHVVALRMNEEKPGDDAVDESKLRIPDAFKNLNCYRKQYIERSWRSQSFIQSNNVSQCSDACSEWTSEQIRERYCLPGFADTLESVRCFKKLPILEDEGDDKKCDADIGDRKDRKIKRAWLYRMKYNLISYRSIEFIYYHIALTCHCNWIIQK